MTGLNKNYPKMYADAVEKIEEYNRKLKKEKEFDVYRYDYEIDRWVCRNENK